MPRRDPLFEKFVVDDRRQTLTWIAVVVAVVVLTLALARWASAQEAKGWAWVGGVTDTSAVIVSAGEPLTVDPPAGGSVSVDKPGHDLARTTLTGLTPDTAYTYRHGDRVGGFRTFPATGTSAPFTFALGSCMRTGPTLPTLLTAAKHDPRLFLFTGDFHYEDIARDDEAVFLATYRRQLTNPNIAPLLRATSIAYVWDDHDFGPNDSDSSSPSKRASTAAYRLAVPHYPLSDASAIYQAFSFGRVRFVVADLRSERVRPSTRPTAGDDESVSGTIMSDRQLAWLTRELVESSRSHDVVFLVSSVPWIDRGASRDSWNGYRVQRRLLATALGDAGVDNLAILSGDAHSVALDDGTNSNFSTGKPFRPVVFHAAPLDQGPSKKGGPYSHGVNDTRGQFGLVTVTYDPTSGRPTVTFTTRTHADEETLRYVWQIPPRAQP